MKSQNELHYIIFIVLVALLLVDGARNSHRGSGRSSNGLRPAFYRKSCPRAEQIVKCTTTSLVRDNPNVNLAAKLIRLQFHDCFVRGCDASILLDPVGNGSVEKQARPNLSVGGFEVIDEIKNRLEQECPGVVSCADIIALSARDAVSAPYGRDLWEVPTGRRDGFISLANDTNGNLPSPFANFTTLKTIFVHINKLSIKDLVLLSGAHTIGISHCGAIVRRLYNFDGNGNADPTLNTTYATELRRKCPTTTSLADTSMEVEMDPNDATEFNNNYYKILLQNKGLFVSDAALLTDKRAFKMVQQLQQHGNGHFFDEFGRSMEKMGAIQVLTGKQGQIRTNCRFVKH